MCGDDFVDYGEDASAGRCVDLDDIFPNRPFLFCVPAPLLGGTWAQKFSPKGVCVVLRIVR